MAFSELAPITPDGRDPAAIERAFQQVNARFKRMVDVVVGMKLVNGDGAFILNGDGNVIRVPSGYVGV